MLHSHWQRVLDSRPPASADAGILWLPELAVARFAGPDVLAFLGGYLTIDPAKLTAATAQSSGEVQTTPFAICNIKGRVIVNGWCYAADAETVDLLVHRSLSQPLAQFMKAYLAFSRTTLTDATETLLLLGSYNTDFALQPEPAAGKLLRLDPSRRLYAASSTTDALAAWGDLPSMAADAWQVGLIRDRLPLVSLATSGQFLPQMLELEKLGAVSFSKGCYLGQEVVARAQHRGQVKRGLAELTWDAGPAPEAGAELVDVEGRTAGTVLQSAAVARLCLAVVALNAAGPFQRRDQPQEPGIRRTA